MTSRGRLLPWIALAALVSHAAPASAQSAGPAGAAKQGNGPAGPPSAQDLYAAAQRLFDKGNYAEALVAFRQAYNASSSPNARLMIGHCLVGLGRAADAYEEMAATQREAAKRAETEPKYTATRDAAAQQIALLEPKVGKVVVDVAGDAVEIMINGSRVARDRLGAPLAVDPGTVLVTAKSADGRTVQKEQTVKAGETAKVSLELPEAIATAGSSAATAPLPTAPAGSATEGGGAAPSSGSVRTAGFAVAGAGVVGLAVFAITGGLAQSRFAQLERECGGQRCTDPKYGGVVDQGRALSTASTVGLVAGIAGLAGGGLMIVLGWPAKAAPSGSQRTTLTVSPAGAGLRSTLTF